METVAMLVVNCLADRSGRFLDNNITRARPRRKLTYASQFDRAVLVTVLGEIPKREAALAEIFRVLKPGGLLSVTEIILDGHFQGRGTVWRLAGAAGFREKPFLGGRFAFSLYLQKPV